MVAAQMVGARGRHNRRGISAGARQHASAAWMALLSLLLLLQCSLVSATTPAGTVISNVATAIFDGGSVTSDPVTFVVAQAAAFTMVAPVTQSSGPGGQVRDYSVSITNAGNGDDTAALNVTSLLGWPATVYRDDDANGIHDGTETTVIANTGVLPAGEQFYCIVAISVPAGAAGTDTALLTATSGFDSSVVTNAMFTTTAVAPPSANFAAYPTSGPRPLTVQFADRSGGVPTAWSWVFGDGGTSTARNPSHEYTSAGNYTVSLTASNAGGSTTSTKGPITVSPAPPVAGFTALLVRGLAPLVVQFVDLSKNSPTAWQWDFGDGGTSTLQNPVHSYSFIGDYRVQLTVSNVDGSDTVTKPDYITVEPLPALVADFSATPLSGPAPLSVTFTDTSTGSPSAWLWDFGDGAAAAEQSPIHQYVDPGTYTVSLTASDGSSSDTKTVPDAISVASGPALVADFSASVTGGPAPLAVTFTDLSAGEPTAWSWSFGDGSGASDENPSHGYTRGGAYTVTLAVSNGAAQSVRTKLRYILVDFADVPSDYWAYAEVMACVKNGVVSGYPDGLYLPEMPVTRDQMATFLARPIAGGDEHVPTAPSEASFPDVPAGSWAFPYIQYVAAQHVVEGYPDGQFGPALPVDRGQMAAFVARAIVDPPGEEGLASYSPPAAATFPDVPTEYWAYRYVEYVASKGIVQGYPGGAYQPEQVVTRDQMAVYLTRAFGLSR